MVRYSNCGVLPPPTFEVYIAVAGECTEHKASYCLRPKHNQQASFSTQRFSKISSTFAQRPILTPRPKNLPKITCHIRRLAAQPNFFYMCPPRLYVDLDAPFINVTYTCHLLDRVGTTLKRTLERTSNPDEIQPYTSSQHSRRRQTPISRKGMIRWSIGMTQPPCCTARRGFRVCCAIGTAIPWTEGPIATT